MRNLLITMYSIAVANLVSPIHQAFATPDLFSMSLEELMELNISVLNRSGQKMTDSPAAISVITEEDIRRSRAMSIPEVLRLVPGVSINRLSGGVYAIGIRGDQGRFADKILVLLDGRAVYLPVFGGVVWELFDVYVPDIKRIEVIRGPGSSLWGANAINGIISIITKKAEETKGRSAYLAAGNVFQFNLGSRSGWLTENGAVRISGNVSDQKRNNLLVGGAAHDAHQRINLYSRWDREWNGITHTSLSRINISSLEDVNTEYSFSLPPINQISYGYPRDPNNTRFGRLYDETNTSYSVSFQEVFQKIESEITQWRASFAVERLRNSGPFWGTGLLNAVDADLQARSTYGRHTVSYGLSSKLSADHWDNRRSRLKIGDKTKVYTIVDIFLQDEASILQGALTLTTGIKLEYNDFTGIEYEPSLRSNYKLAQGLTMWTGLSRAIRRPNRLDDGMKYLYALSPPTGDIPLPQKITLFEGMTARSEVLHSYEFGLKGDSKLLNRTGIWDVSLFYNQYSGLTSPNIGDAINSASFMSRPYPHLDIAVPLSNSGRLYTRGIEATYSMQLSPSAKLAAWYTLLTANKHDLLGGASSHPTGPQAQYLIRVTTSPYKATEFDVTYRQNSDGFRGFNVASNKALDVRIGWSPNSHWSMELLGTDLLKSEHAEGMSPVSFFDRPIVSYQRGVLARLKYLVD